nr:transferrin-binding protein-like solute binding protein [Psychrobacter sp. PraFG1]UNK05030.1 transferrin-binding protein-like solute binding protein [Psychrobacter sp. PraFG1]
MAIRDDQSDFTTTVDKDGSLVPVDNRKGDNFKSFDKGVVRADMVKPDSVLKPIDVSLKQSGSVKVDAGKGSFNPTFNYKSVYENFDSQMQVGHVYGNFDSAAGEVSRATNVYVQGYLTATEAMDRLKDINEGKAQYTGVATYIENIHLGDNANTAPVKGTSAFDVDFVNNSVKGELAFDGNFKYMPEGNKIGIEATIDGNTFAGNVNGIDTAGGFYGEDAKFLGGIYQDAAIEGGKGDLPGTGTRFKVHSELKNSKVSRLLLSL